MLEHHLILQVVHYDPATGVFTRLQATGPKQKVGERADQPHGRGDNAYRTVRLFKRTYRAHALAWFYMTGEWALPFVDHKDCSKGNNAFSNLRKSNPALNRANSRLASNNLSGYKGVSRVSSSGRYAAKITVAGRTISLGTRKHAKNAHKLYCRAATNFFGEFARHA